MKKIGFIAISVIFSSCEKNIDFKLEDSSPTLVVEASIENDKAPQVILTKSTSFYSEISPELLTESFVHDADVYISNGTVTHKLKEYTQPFIGNLNFYYYGIDSTDLATAFVGEFNKSYNLRIVSEGKEYLSSTTIPALAWYPDSLFFKPVPFEPDTNARGMYVHATEPAGLGNYMRYFTKINSEPFYPGVPTSVYSDQIIDGTTYTIQVEPGQSRNLSADPNAMKRKLMVSDTLTLKFCNIDRASYTFWNTWEFAFQAIGNPFSQPNKVIGNISNGALGSFCGYAAWYHTYIVN